MRSLAIAEAKEKLLSEQEAATTLGISYAMLRILRARKAINHLRVGRRVLYTPAHLENFVRSCEQIAA
jgi:hypothetical protein